ncbi:hypothetical protein MY04_3145 [Flammeovirga sp. MY04]|uniref:hypothetical protein n=1 Tax=Flammeovirga sp. MY04 TaxID=1191459 RepID=UPI000806392A|nr:hypothetical protein [Flammeovirga sp. MY04]ANQ50510.1 hypothetical protein MY04_3145 [Flammeovirga sp. MY04]
MYCTKQLLLITALSGVVFFSCGTKKNTDSSDLVYEEIPVKEKKKEEKRKSLKKRKANR